MLKIQSSYIVIVVIHYPSFATDEYLTEFHITCRGVAFASYLDALYS